MSTIRKTCEDKILFILFTFKKELIGDKNSETAFDVIRKHGLKWEDFQDPLNQSLYKSIQNQLFNGLPDIDFLSIVNYRPKEYKVFEQQANEYMMHITNLISTNFASFSELDKLIYKLKEFNLKDFWRYNAQLIIGSNFENENVIEFGNVIVSKYQDFYNRLMSGVVTKNSHSNNMGDELERKMNLVATGQSVGVAIHMPSFQTFFGGWSPPDFIIIGARPSMGKTATILSLAWESAKHSHIAFFTFEMSANQIKNKVASNLSGIDYNKIERGQINHQELSLVRQAYDIIDESKLIVLGQDFVKIEALKNEARKLHRMGKLDLIVIDYLQLMKTDEKHASREQSVAHISRELKLLCVELNIPIIALCQVGRDCENRTNKRPMLSDLRESGSIEQDADIVAFLFREAYYYDKNIDVPYEKKFLTEFIVAKGRNIGTTVLYFMNDVINSRTHDDVNIFN
jgi:replicative DNA helicase